MAEPVLGLEDVTLADQNGCDSVSQSMQGDVAVPGAMGKVGDSIGRAKSAFSDAFKGGNR